MLLPKILLTKIRYQKSVNQNVVPKNVVTKNLLPIAYYFKNVVTKNPGIAPLPPYLAAKCCFYIHESYTVSRNSTVSPQKTQDLFKN